MTNKLGGQHVVHNCICLWSNMLCMISKKKRNLVETQPLNELQFESSLGQTTAIEPLVHFKDKKSLSAGTCM